MANFGKTGLQAAFVTGGVMLAGLAGAPQAAHAQLYKAGDLTVTGSISGTTDYVFRGFSQSAEDPALQGTIDAAYKWFYVGAFVSMIEFGDDAAGSLVRSGQGKSIATAEIDIYGGIKVPVGKMLELDVGVIGYLYPGALDGPGRFNAKELDYFEIKAGGTFKPMDPLAFTLFGYYSPEYTGGTGEVFTLEGGAAYTFPTFSKVATTVSALLGYQTGDKAAWKTVFGNGEDNYLYWNAGVAFTFAERFTVDLRYWDTNVKDNVGSGGVAGFCTGFVLQCDERFVATAKVTF